jgi:hypothetical protein
MTDFSGPFPIEIGSKNFYYEMIRLIKSAKKSVWFYSVSACFGFYSKGVHVFEDMIKELQHKIDTRIPEYDIKCLIKVDNHGIDLFSADHLRFLNKDREIVKQITSLSENENYQFLLIDIETDSPKLLYSNIQESRKTEILKITINELSGGVYFDFKCETFDKFINLFNTKWDQGSSLDNTVKDFYYDRVKKLIHDFDAPRCPLKEVCISHNLASYLRGNLGSDMVETELACPNGRIDIVIGHADEKKKIVGVEVKYSLSQDKIDAVVGQATKYKDVCDNVIVYSVSPKYEHSEAVRFRKNLKKNGIEIIEKR